MQGMSALGGDDVPILAKVALTHHQHLLACDNIFATVCPAPLFNHIYLTNGFLTQLTHRA